jgi:hypothetical protein
MLDGSFACTRLQIVSPVDTVDFGLLPYRPIIQASTIRESFGFIPPEVATDYQVGHKRWAAKLRIDRRNPDPTKVRLAKRDAVAHEANLSPSGVVSNKRRREIQHEVEESLLPDTEARASVVDVVIDGDIVFVGTASETDSSIVQSALRDIGVEAALVNSWPSLDEGAGFLSSVAMREQDGMMIEPEKGAVIMDPPNDMHPTISLSGAVTQECLRLISQGYMPRKAKIVWGDMTLTIGADGKCRGMKVEAHGETWTDALDIRIEALHELYAQLDAYGAQVSEEVDDSVATNDREHEISGSVDDNVAALQASMARDIGLGASSSPPS